MMDQKKTGRVWLQLLGFTVLLGMLTFLRAQNQPVVAQSDSAGQVFLPMIMSQNSTEATEVFYNIDSPTEDQLNALTTSVEPTGLKVASGPGTLALYSETNGVRKTLIDITCTGQQCTNNTVQVSGAVPADSQSGDNLKITISVNGVLKVIVEQVTQKLVTVSFVENDVVTKILKFRCSNCDIKVDIPSDVIEPTGTPAPAPSTTPSPAPTATPVATPIPGGTPGPYAIVFVSRQIPSNGSIYWDVPKDMPGVGPHSRFRVAAPGKLIIRESDGTLRVLIDGAAPTAATLNLIDVNAPDVSYDGKTIVFAGLPSGRYGTGPVTNPDAWRLYTIRTDGSNLRQITLSDQNLDLSQFGAAAGGLDAYDDTDPAWLPDGRIVFSSTRWPSYGHYSGVRATNLYVVNADGAALHRITAERNGADRPLVDPLTGKIVYARWWRNHRFATNQMDTVADANGGYLRKDGLTADRNNQVGGADFLFRNTWHAASINPDGTGLDQWGGVHHHLDANHMYGGAFTPAGVLIANYFPMTNMTEASGFGGLRRYVRGPGTYSPILGVTALSQNYAHPSNPTSYGIFNSAYASEPAVLPDGRIVVSWAADVNQDYGLYLINADGTGLTKVYDNPGTTELRARVVAARPVPPIIADSVPLAASLLPPPAQGPYNQDGTFVFNALNVYFNGPVDTEITNAPPVGSAETIRFFIDQQRTSPGSFPNLDWPILLGERSINPDGSVLEPSAPANVPVFEQIRAADGTVPFSPGSTGSGAHVAGLNFGRPGQVQRCVGCHTGHTMIAVPATDAEALWTNLAPGAAVSVSTTRDANQNKGLIDRRVMTGEIWRYWASASGQTASQWVQLTFPVPVTVRTIRLYNPRSGGEANSSIVVNKATVHLYSDAAGTVEVGVQTTGALSVSGTNVPFNDVRARVVRVEINEVAGTFYGAKVASLAEIEVVARGEAGP